jgi:hypothetical protein
MRARPFGTSFLFAGLLFVAKTAHADPLVDLFQTICVVNNADAAPALAIADNGGWIAIPPPMLEKLSKGQFSNPNGRMRSTDKAFVILITAHGEFPSLPGIQANVCATAITTTPAEDFDAAVAAVAGVSPDPTLCGKTNCYAWREVDSRKIQVSRETPDLRQIVEAGELKMLMTRKSDTTTMVMYVVPYK